MYYLYLDESGDPGDYLDENCKVIKNSSKYFTLAGIIVNQTEIHKLNQQIEDLVHKYFKSIPLDKNFKLHYQPLARHTPPYDKLSHENRIRCADDVFKTINDSKCTLLSVSINIEKHCKRYDWPANPKAYSMLIMLERFQGFLTEQNSDGQAIYERFNKQERKKIESTMIRLQTLLPMRYRVELNNIKGRVKSGDPKQEPILQLADFFAYATQKKCIDKAKRRRWESIKDNYFRLGERSVVRGDVVI